MSGTNYGDTGRPSQTTVIGAGGPDYTTTHGTTTHASTTQGTRHSVDYSVQAVPRDRIRWGPVVAGLFAALSTLALLAALGLAIGLSSVDRDDSARAFGIGAGIWGALSGIIAFAFGGYIAACTAATPATGANRKGTLKDDNGVLQGAMVWMVAIPLSIYFLASGLTRAAGTAASAAGTAAQTAATVAAPTAGAAAEQRMDREGGVENAAESTANQAAAATQQAAGAMSNAVQQVRQSVDGRDVEQVADAGAKGAWGTLISMLVSLAAAAAGGYLGGKSRNAVLD